MSVLKEEFNTHDWSGVSTWTRISMEEWDHLSDPDREILVTKNGIVFVQRKELKRW